MRCSKCQYIGFDNSDRCRNCGYEFSLSGDEDVLDLPMRTGDEPSGPLADFSLADRDTPVTPPASPVPTPQPAARRRGHSARSTASGELPLFRGRNRDDEAPLVSLPAAPRAPVSVRKSTVAHRAPQRPVSEELHLNLELENTAQIDESDETESNEDADDAAPVTLPHRTVSAQTAVEVDVAPIIPRIVAAMMDLGLLVGIDALILHRTLKLGGLELGDAALIPVIPFVAFIALLNGGYVAAFTAAGGQTIGKMLTGIRVVTSEEGALTDRVPVGPSALRAVGYLISALPAGLGFLPVLLSAERRGLHDRLAHTRVVKA